MYSGDKKSIHLCEQKEHNVYEGDSFMTKKGERLKQANFPRFVMETRKHFDLQKFLGSLMGKFA